MQFEVYALLTQPGIFISVVKAELLGIVSADNQTEAKKQASKVYAGVLPAGATINVEGKW